MEDLKRPLPRLIVRLPYNDIAIPKSRHIIRSYDIYEAREFINGNKEKA